MKHNLTTYTANDIINKIAEQLQVDVLRECMEISIRMPEKLGKGTISGFDFRTGIHLVLFDIKAKTDWILNFETDKPPPVIFKSNIKAGIWHSFNNDYIFYKLNPQQCSITANTSKAKEMFSFAANTHLLFCMVMIDREEYFEKIECYIKSLPSKLQEMYSDVKAKQAFFYEGNYSLGIADIVHEIAQDTNKDIARATFMEGKALQMVSKFVRLYSDDLLPGSKQRVLRQLDIDKIVEAKDILTKQLSDPPVITELAKQIGINQDKLKRGFKQIFDRTIRNFIIEERLSIARIMLLQSEKQIGEIAYAIGYSNKSYFSRIFKKKYGVLPKDYAQHITDKINVLNENEVIF